MLPMWAFARSGAAAACRQLSLDAVVASNTRSLCMAAAHASSSSGSSSSRSTSSRVPASLAGAGLGLMGSTCVLQAEAPAQQPPAGSANSQGGVDAYKRPADLHGLPKDIELYQFEVCPYCCKVKAALDYYKLPYNVVEVNPLTKAQLKWSEYKKVPVVKMDGSVVVDSTAIMSRLAAEYEAAQAGGGSRLSRGKGAAKSATEVEEEEQWRRWVDNRLVKVITANIYRSWDESWNTFQYMTQQTNWNWGLREVARWSGAVLMWQIGKKMPAKYNITGDLREALYKDLNEMVDAMKGAPFLGGDAPNLADLSAYGVLCSVYHTPTFEDAMAHSKAKPWFERMQNRVGPSKRIPDTPAAA